MGILNKKAFSVIEYTVLFVIIIGAFLVMRNYIQRGVFGLWVQPGQSFSFGRQYDPQKSVECDFDPASNLWYDRNCFRSMSSQQCKAWDTPCQEAIMSGSCSVNSSSYCAQLDGVTPGNPSPPSNLAPSNPGNSCGPGLIQDPNGGCCAELDTCAFGSYCKGPNDPCNGATNNGGDNGGTQ